MRRPFSSTSVRDPPRPRKEAADWPETVEEAVLVASIAAEPKFALTRLSTSSTVWTPLRSISSRRMIWTGSAVSPSMRGTREPTTSTRGSDGPSVSAWAPVEASIKPAAAVRKLILVFPPADQASSVPFSAAACWYRSRGPPAAGAECGRESIASNPVHSHRSPTNHENRDLKRPFAGLNRLHPSELPETMAPWQRTPRFHLLRA